MDSSGLHVVTNIGELVTNTPLAHLVGIPCSGPVSREQLGIIRDAWMTHRDGKVESTGQGSPPAQVLGKSPAGVTDAEGGLVLPWLVDCHTHPIYAGSRAAEFAQRIDGKTYEQIAAAGGGIVSTVNATRAASTSDLTAMAATRLMTFLSHGVTTVEIKSGYGLSVSEELRHLRLMKTLATRTPQTLSRTCLAFHAIPQGIAKASYINDISQTLLPAIAKESLADAVDAFVERGYYSVDDVSSFFAAATGFGLGIHIHADELSDANAAALAARLGAWSADHLQYAAEPGITALAKAGTVAVVLPGTSLYTRIPYADGPRLRRHNCWIAIATDHNPGSCVIDNLPLIAAIAALHCQLTVAETIAGITIVAARALNLHHRKGALTLGYDADFVMHPATTIDEWLADFGRTPPHQVWVGGAATKLD